MGQGLAGYLIRRLLWAVPVLIAVSMLVFLLLRFTPGDPVDTLLGNRYDEELAARLRARYGYDQPVHVQYLKYLENLFQGDLGISTRHADFSVAEVIIPKVRVSAAMGLMAVIVGFGLGIPVGIFAALRRGSSLDPLTIGFWLLLDSMPILVVAPAAIWLFALALGWVNLSYAGVLHPNIILPVVLISLPGVAGVARIMRASIIQILGEDFIRTARAKGLRERTVVTRHITRNALLPMVTVIGLSLPGIAAGSLFTELFFGIPGIGREYLQSLLDRDYDVVLALVLLGSALFVFANIAVDVAYGFIDPRVRVGATRGGGG